MKPQSENRSPSPSPAVRHRATDSEAAHSHQRRNRTHYVAGRGSDDSMIVWPPMVVVLNTRLGKQEGSDKWVGMDNQDLMDYFKEYEPVEGRSAYGSQGHCGASLLIFDSSVLGYRQAKRLHDRFIQEGRGRYEWYKQKRWRQQGTEKYGYMVTREEELKMFSTRHGDTQKLKYEMMPYRMVVGNGKEMGGSIQKEASLEREISIEIGQEKVLEGLCKCDLEIEATMRMLTEPSVEHNYEIESLNEQFSSSPRSAGADQDQTSSTTEFRNQMNLADGEHDGTNVNGMASGGKRKERPMWCAIL